MTSPELERAGQAFYENFCRGQPWDEATEGWKLASREGAAAVIRSALMEPSKEVVKTMVEAFANQSGFGIYEHTPETTLDIYRRGLRAALRAAAMKMLGEE